MSPPRLHNPPPAVKPSPDHGASFSTSSSEASRHHISKPQHQSPRTHNSGHGHSTPEQEQTCYVLTLLTDKAHYQKMSNLRRQWFPSKILKVDAHVTLFHALPGNELDTIKKDLTSVAKQTSTFSIKVTKDDMFKLGKGVAFNLRGGQKEAAGIRTELRQRWMPVLSEQDQRRGWKGHYTIMNKEDDTERIEECLSEVGDFGGSSGRAMGLRLWRYDRGWWKDAEDFLFQDGGRKHLYQVQRMPQEEIHTTRLSRGAMIHPNLFKSFSLSYLKESLLRWIHLKHAATG